MPELGIWMQQIRVLDAELGRLAWEQETADADVGAGQAECEKQRQQLLLSPELGDLLAANIEPACRALATATKIGRRNSSTPCRKLRHGATQRALGLWGAARLENDFAVLAPALAEVVRLVPRARGGSFGSGVRYCFSPTMRCSTKTIRVNARHLCARCSRSSPSPPCARRKRRQSLRRRMRSRIG